MLYLLHLQRGSASRWIPVAQCTAAGLERALLDADLGERADRLAKLLAKDPAMAVWAADQAEQAQLEFASCTHAARWLAERLADRLARAIDIDRPCPHIAPADVHRIVNFYGETLLWTGWGTTTTGSSELADSGLYWDAVADASDRLLAMCPHRPAEAALLPTFEPVLSAPGSSGSDQRDFTSCLDIDYFLHPAPGVASRLPLLARRLAQLDKLEAERCSFDERLEVEKMAALRELAYGASHEINNPLANISARAQTLLRDEADEARRQKLAAIQKQAQRAHEMIADLMHFAHPPRLDRQVCDLREIVTQVVDEQNDDAAQRDVKLRVRGDSRPMLLEGDTPQLTVAIRAVLQNAIEAVGTGGQVEVMLSRRGSPAGLGGWAAVTVSDNGPGMDDRARRHLFDPFFCGREAGRGLGFGLTKCWRIVADHGGRIDVASVLGRGTQLIISLPMIDTRARLAS